MPGFEKVKQLAKTVAIFRNRHVLFLMAGIVVGLVFVLMLLQDAGDKIPVDEVAEAGSPGRTRIEVRTTPAVRIQRSRMDKRNVKRSAAASRRQRNRLRAQATSTPEPGDAYLGESLTGVEPGHNTDKIFEQAGAEFGVSPDLLKAVAVVESGARHGTGAVNERGGRGIMGLREGELVDTLSEAADLLGVDKVILVRDPVQNVRGAAALIRKYHDAAANEADVERPWEIALSRYSGLPADAAVTYAQDIRNILIEGLVQANADGTTLSIRAGQGLE